VIGVNVQGRGVGDAGFAIPIGVAEEVVSAIREGRKSLDPPTIGAATAPISPGLAQLLDLTVEHGLLIRSLSPGGPAARAGLRPLGPGRRSGDIIVAVAGEPVREPSDIPTVLRDHEASGRVRVQVIRRGRRKTLRLRLARR
jgi:serine protease Do